MTRFLYILVAVTVLGFFQPARAALISVGTFPATPSPPISIPAGDFLVPVDAQGAAGLSNWQFDLTFDPTVVQEVDPGDGSSGIYGADFTPGDPTTTSFILAGFPFNSFGVVSGVAAEYPSLLDGVSGDGVLAYILFQFQTGHESDSPSFAVDNVTVQEAAPVPEPSSLSMLVLGLLVIALHRKLRPST